jgi:type IV pilus assembly protein PilQ
LVRVQAAETVATLDGLSIGADIVTITLSAPAQHNGFLTANPPRLVVELMDTENQVGVKEVAGKGKYLKRVRAAQFQRTPRMVSRIVMDLTEMAGYRLAQSGNKLVVQLVGEGSAAASASDAKPALPIAASAPVASSDAAPIAAAPAAVKPAVRKAKRKPAAPVAASGPIDSTTLAVESGQPAVAASRPSPKVSLEEADLSAVAPSPSIPADKPVMAAAAAPVEAAAPAAYRRPAIVAKSEAAAVEATVKEMKTEVSPELASMAKSKSTEDAVPAAKPEAVREPESESAPAKPALRRSAYRSDIMSRLARDLVTLDFDNTDIKDVFKLLAAKAKVNIIYGDDVAVVRPLTLHLSEVPFNEAMQTILSMTGLVTNQVGDNILRVLTPVQMAKDRTVATTQTKVIPLNYSKAADILAAVNAVRTAEGRPGTASADTKTNSLIITESMDGLVATERLISQLDQRPRQVLIEAKLVEVSLSNSLNYGIQWDYFSRDTGKFMGKDGTSYNGTSVYPVPAVGASAVNLTDLNNGNMHNLNGLLGPGAGALGRGTGVNLPASSVFGALTLGRITNNYFLNMTLTAAAAQGKVKVLSDPKIATLNNQPANINVTTSYPYVTSNVASTGVSTQKVEYVITGIKLSVTPTINADGRITLDINPDVSQPSASAAASITGAPAYDVRSAKTTVLVKDGETIVIGGLISDTVSDQIAKIPLLGDIPILGWLFRKKSKTRSRSELLIFVTPKIMPD